MQATVAVTGHGRAMCGAEMRAAPHNLAHDFDRVAVSDHGKYVLHPANVASGNAYMPASTL